MAEDYYKTLGVGRDASQAEIQKAYRGMARKYHPDLHPDDKTAKQKFQEVQQAFDVLNDPSKRELYDRYGSSFENVAGGGRPGGGASSWSGEFGGGGAEEFDFSQFFGERFGAGEGGGGGFADIFNQFRRASGEQPRARGRTRRRGADLRYELEVPFLTAVNGGEVHISVPRGDGKPESLAIKIPAGISDGKTMRLRGQGEPGPGQPGDLLISVRVAPHPFFQRSGNNLLVKVPVTLAEAALGAKVDVPTPRGVVAVQVPPGTSSGKRLRLKGQGVASSNGAGDLLAEIQIVLPEHMDEESVELIRKFDRRNPVDPRRHLR